MQTLQEFPFHLVLNIIYRSYDSTKTTEYQVTFSEVERSIPYFMEVTQDLIAL